MILLKDEFYLLNKKWIQFKIYSQEAAISDESIGPVLGQYGLNSQKFCTEFNERSFFIKQGVLVQVYAYFFVDHLNKHLYFSIGKPWNNYIIYHSLNIQNGFLFNDLIELPENEILDLDVLYFYKGIKILGFNDISYWYTYYNLYNKLKSLKYY